MGVWISRGNFISLLYKACAVSLYTILVRKIGGHFVTLFFNMSQNDLKLPNRILLIFSAIHIKSFAFRFATPSYRNNCHNTIRSGLEHIVICGTQIMTTVIVTPLGVFAIAANSFAITAESLCICPVWDCRCCTTLVGQSIGADRRKLVRSFARITIFIWYDRYGVIGVLMYLFAPQIIG